MWADNETDIDLLGFDYLVDALELVLTDETLYPITVGVLGDWGSGKTSLMRMAEDHIAARDEFLCIDFSPWRFESYDDVKTALMATVLRQIEVRLAKDARAAEDADEGIDADKQRRAQERLGRLWRRVRRFVPLTTPAIGAGVGAGAGALGLPPEVGQAATGVVGRVIDAVQVEAERPDADAMSADGGTPEYTSAAGFRADFEALVRDIDGLAAVIVFVDDLDRCLPETIIETFEAIRLFLHVPKTAYVLAAHPAIVEAAVAHRYEGNREGDANLGRDYLEKIVQLPITVPALSEPEVETYINLLFAERHLDETAFTAVRQSAQRYRESNHLAVAMNYGIAKDALSNQVDDELQEQFALAAGIGPTLARGLRGNPRQIKRFLNALTLRLRTAAKRDVKLSGAVLAKLMVLEYLHQPEFQRLFEWQLAQNGRPVELADVEAIVMDGVDPKTVAAASREWAENPSIQAWAAVEPRLADTVLGRYFFFSREGLSPAAPAARLTGDQQELLGALQGTIAASRQGAVTRVVALDPVMRNPVYEALLAVLIRDPSAAPAARSALEIAARVPELVQAFARTLGEIPPKSVPQSLPLQLKAAFGVLPADIEAIFMTWEQSTVRGLQTAVKRALRGST